MKTSIPKTKSERLEAALTPAERQARRRAKLKNSFVTLQVLQSDLNTAVIIIDSTIMTLKMIALDNLDSKSLYIATRQLENAVCYLDHSRGPQCFKRRSCDVKNSTELVQNS